MADYGIMLYGYNAVDAEKIRSLIESVIKDEVDVISASEKENILIREILENAEPGVFVENEHKILMFLGDYTTDDLHDSMSKLPSEGDIKRPIFCTLTDRNFFWKLSDLIEDLLEEHRVWKEKKEAEEA